jgi:hypothetical protein
LAFNVTGFSYNGSSRTVCWQMIDPAVFAQCYRDSSKSCCWPARTQGETPTSPAKPVPHPKRGAEERRACRNQRRLQPTRRSQAACAEGYVAKTGRQAHHKPVRRLLTSQPDKQQSPQPAVIKPATAATNSKTPRRKFCNRHNQLKKVERKPADKTACKYQSGQKSNGKAAKVND